MPGGDPWEQAVDVCGLYLNPSVNELVLSVDDEKTAIGAHSRKHPTAPAGPGCIARRELEYVRHAPPA